MQSSFIQSGGSTFSSGAGAPAGGSDGDTYLRTATLAFYENQSGSWVILFYGASAVSDLEVTFKTPTAGDKAATLG